MTNEQNNQIEMKPVNMMELPTILSHSIEWVPISTNPRNGIWFTQNLITPLYINMNRSKVLYEKFDALYCFGHNENGNISVDRCYNLSSWYGNDKGQLLLEECDTVSDVCRYNTANIIPIFTDGDKYYDANGLEYVGTIFHTYYNVDKSCTVKLVLLEKRLNVNWDAARNTGKIVTGPDEIFKQEDVVINKKVKSVLDDAIEYYFLTKRGKSTDELLKELIDQLYN